MGDKAKRKADAISRKGFLRGGLASLALFALDGLPVFAAPPDWKPKRKPDIVFGMLADTHLMTAWDAKSIYGTMSLDYIRNAFKYFKEVGVDAVIHLGDAAHRGQVRGLEFHREEFDKVFGTDNPPPMPRSRLTWTKSTRAERSSCQNG